MALRRAAARARAFGDDIPRGHAVERVVERLTHQRLVSQIAVFHVETEVAHVLPAMTLEELLHRRDARGEIVLSREQDRWSQLVNVMGRIMNPAPAGED